MQKIPPVTLALLIANIAIFLLQQVGGDYLIVHFALWPFGDAHYFPTESGLTERIGFEPWQLLSYAFLHGGFTHIGFNMFALWMFGGPVESALGARRYTFYYFICVIGAACAQLAVIHFFKPEDFYPTLGASGGVFGLLLATAILYPTGKIVEFPIPISLPTPIFVVIYMASELFYGITGTQEGVAHFAHLGGAVAGLLVLLVWRNRSLRSPS